MKQTWLCPICGSNKWMAKKRRMWKIPFFHDRKLMTCDICKCSSMYPIPKIIELYKINENYWKIFSPPSKIYLEIEKKQIESRINYLEKFFNLGLIKKILDIGAGSGTFLDLFKEKFPNFTEYYAIETDKSKRNILYSKGTKNVFYSIDDILDFEFQLIIMSHILEHLTNPKEYLRKLLEYMKMGDLLFLEVPNQENLYLKSLGAHIFVFSISGLSSLLKNLGFHILNITTVGYSISKLISEKSFFKEIKRVIFNFITGKQIRILFKRMERNKIINYYFIKNHLNKKRNNLLHSLMLHNYGKDGIFIRILAQK